jgi:ADP-heptose:LPS heptosyltransferase
MHLASATPTPTIGLFVTTDPERYRPRKQTDLSPVVASQDPAQVARVCVEHLRRCRGSDPVAAVQGGEC